MISASIWWGDLLSFLKAAVAQPRRVSAVLPSGSSLARLMTREVNLNAATIIELGAGTGVFTACLLKRGVHPSQLILVEIDASLAERLRQRYPQAQVLCRDAAQLGDSNLIQRPGARNVISGLPLLSMPPQEVTAVLRATFDHSPPDTTFFQFTYGLRCPVSGSVLKSLGLQANYVGCSLANLPPASVYRITHSIKGR